MELRNRRTRPERNIRHRSLLRTSLKHRRLCRLRFGLCRRSHNIRHNKSTVVTYDRHAAVFSNHRELTSNRYNPRQRLPFLDLQKLSTAGTCLRLCICSHPLGSRHHGRSGLIVCEYNNALMGGANHIQVGLQGWRARASMRRCKNTTFPSDPVGSVFAFADQPCTATRDA